MMRFGVKIVAAFFGSAVLAGLSCHAGWALPPTEPFNLVGATFDDGGTLTGSFYFNFVVNLSPALPQFYDIQVTTSAGSVLPGSNFTSSDVCYNDHKKFVCAPGDNFVLSLATGTPGEPGYDRLQLATFFAPSALEGQIGVLDPAASYEIGCTQNGCFSRRISAGAIRVVVGCQQAPSGCAP